MEIDVSHIPGAQNRSQPLGPSFSDTSWFHKSGAIED